MATSTPAPVIPLDQPRPKTASERGKAFRERQRQRSAVRSAKPAPQPSEKSKTFANGEPTFAELERTTKALVDACLRGMEAARCFTVRVRR
jgi:flagellar hook-length control protein FliK